MAHQRAAEYARGGAIGCAPARIAAADLADQGARRRAADRAFHRRALARLGRLLLGGRGLLGLLRGLRLEREGIGADIAHRPLVAIALVLRLLASAVCPALGNA